MIKFLRFWVWGVPTAMRRRAKNLLYSIGHWIYRVLMPFPRIRAFFSKLNGKMHIFKNPQAVVTYNLSSVPKQKNKGQDKKLPQQMNVAMIVDEFSYNSFKYECNVYPLEPGSWKKVFKDNKIDFFFCESAWAGVDSLRRPWRGKIYCSINFPRENRGVLLEILSYCKKNKIPTVFWNKEDPMHYEDKVHNFVDTALKFDHIFTTAKECVKRYKQEYGHPSVHLLMFATQPKIFNPIEKYQRTDDIVFAGSWYNQHPDRCEEMGKILDSLAKEHRLKIYNRQSENDDPNHVFPERYSPFIHPRLAHDQLDIAYKGSRYALNINTVNDSETMFARRVYELMSSNTLVISNYSKGMEQLFGTDVIFADGKSQLDLSNADEKRERCLYNVLQHHTYKQRFSEILRNIGIDFYEEKKLVNIIYHVSNLEESKNAVNHFYSITWQYKKGVLLVSRGCAPQTLQNIVMECNGGLITVYSTHYVEQYDPQFYMNLGLVVLADIDMEQAFISNAMIHYSYLPQDISIAKGQDKKYDFGSFKDSYYILTCSNSLILSDGCLKIKIHEDIYLT